jgi:hypothetical protein
MRIRTGGALAAVAVALLSGCAGSSSPAAAPTGTPAAAANSATPTAAATTPAAHRPRKKHPRPAATTPAAVAPTTAAAQPVATAAHRPRPPFRYSVATVTARSLGDSWHKGCPVGPSGLRAITMTYWGFDRAAHQGVLISSTRAVPAYVSAFRDIYRAGFPIRRMVPISEYGGSDDRSMEHDNTSAFNCRAAVSDGPKHWSMHAYGEAVDLNPLENPYYLNGRVYPPAGEPYLDRSNVRRGMVVAGSAPVRAFSAVGWGWGGSWSSSPDYQHFSSSGS